MKFEVDPEQDREHHDVADDHDPQPRLARNAAFLLASIVDVSVAKALGS
jgi:hypothetical protein